MAINRFCPHCGAEYGEAGMFCVECGNKLSPDMLWPTQEAEEPAGSDTVAEAETPEAEAIILSDPASVRSGLKPIEGMLTLTPEKLCFRAAGGYEEFSVEIPLDRIVKVTAGRPSAGTADLSVDSGGRTSSFEVSAKVKWDEILREAVKGQRSGN